MACEGSALSDERIGEALIKEVIEKQLEKVPSEGVPPITGHRVQTPEEQKVVDQLAKMTKLIGDKLRDDVEFKLFNDSIDGLARIPGCKSDQFRQVAFKVFDDGITWEKIIVLFYAAGRLAVKLVEAHLPESVWDIMKLTVDFFKNRLLGWICEHGGWISSFSELAMVSLQRVSTGPVYGVLLFAAGLAVGCMVTLRLLRHQ